MSIWYPYDWKTSPAFELSFVLQIITVGFAGYCYVATESIFPYISFIIAGHFNTLGLKTLS